MKKNFKYYSKRKIIRFWNFLNGRECFSQSIVHGKFFYNFITFSCRISSYYVRINKIIGFGKGVNSRSEPLFLNPNPCFNSIGRAAREKVFFFLVNNKKKSCEFSEINFKESFYLKKNKILNLYGFLYSKTILKFFSKLNSEFFWNYLIFKKYREKKFYIKAGIKYGGSYIVYLGQKNFSIHTHSACILTLENFYFLEKSCKNCFVQQNKDWKKFQNKIRLAQQVSKKIILIHFFSEKNKKKKKTWIVIEYNFERWIPRSNIDLSTLKQFFGKHFF